MEEALSRLTPNYSGNSLSLTTTSTKQQQRRRKRADATHSHGGSPLSAEEKLLLKHLCKLAVWDQMEDLAIKYLEMSRLLMVEPNNGKSKSIGSDAAGTVDVLFLRYILLLAMVKGMENLCLLIIESSASSYISYDESILQNSILQNYSDFKERELMLQKVNLKAKQHHCNNYFPTFFHIATSLGLETVLLAMLTSPHANASQSSQRNFPFLPRTSSVWNYFTPLHVAIGWNQMGNTSLVEIILSSSCQDLLQVTDLPFDEIYVLNIPLLQGLFKLRDQYREDILVQQKVSSFDEPRSPETKKKIIVKEQQQLITLEDFCRAVNNILILRLLSRNSPGRRRKSISTLQPTQSLENNEEGFIVGANAADLALKKAHTFDASPLTTLNITNTGIITRSSSAGTPSSLESNGSTDLEDSLSTASNTSSRKSASLPKKASSLSRWFFKKK